MASLLLKDLKEAAAEMVSMFDHYSNAPAKEMVADLLVYGFLRGRYLKVKRQHAVGKAKGNGKKRPQIDFRFGTVSPYVIEFAFRPRGGTVQLYGSQNIDELKKLTKRGPPTRRALLLLDLRTKGPVSKESLRATYDKLNAGKGKFDRWPVRVVYAHVDGTSYDFPWQPKKK